MTVATVIVAGGTLGLWSATRRLVLNAERASEAQLRAYVMVFHAEIVNDFVHVKVKNFGHTPALSLRYRLDLKVSEWPLRSAFRDSNPASALLGSFAPEDELTIRAEIPLVSEDMGRTDKAFYAYGAVDYDDVFGKTRQTTFCYFSHTEGWNRSGELHICQLGNKTT